MSRFSQGGPQFGVRDARIATNNEDGTFGTLEDVPSVQRVGFSLATVNAQLEGDDEITATASVVTSGEVTLRMGSVKPEILAVILGASPSSGGGTRTTKVRGGKQLPYFGVMAKINAAEGGSDTHLFVPRCKLMGTLEFGFEYGQFAIPEATFSCVVDPNFTDADGESCLFYLIDHETAEDITAFPTAS